MTRDLSTFPFSKHIRNKLMNAGFTSDKCLKDVTPLSLSKDTGLSKEEALNVIRVIKGEVYNSTTNTQKDYSAFALAHKENMTNGIVTFSQKIDTMLGDGMPVGKLTEISGVPGVGKTQFSMQLCVDATIPDCFGGVQGQSIYIDTEGSFVAERVAQIAKATVSHCHHVANSTKDADMMHDIQTFTVESILKSIHYFRCTSTVELIALSHQLPEFIEKNCKNVKMIAVDSFAFHFRHSWQDMSSRTRVMSSLAQQFIKIASMSQCAVVFVNQMTTKFSNVGDSKIIPALGESWSHVCPNRLLLFWQDGCRYANLFKSPNRKEDTVPYTITEGGIRDCEVSSPLPSTDSEEPTAKRKRL